MMNLFSDFKKVSKEEWSNKLIQDLKGKPKELLTINDEIEGISYSSFVHNEDSIHRSGPGNLPYTRGTNRPTNDWKNCHYEIISNEKDNNAKALNALMSGSDMLWFRSNKNSVNWSDVLADIQTEYINVVIETAQADDITMLVNSGKKNITYGYDAYKNGFDQLNSLFSLFRKEQVPFLLVDASNIQQAGGNISQEIAFALNVGHEYILKLMNEGFTIDEASACIQFKFGVGSNYFNESLKFRIFRTLWTNVVAAYRPQHKCSHNATVHAFITHMNKSVKDPYTNLLRQTTEVMSAVNGNIDSVCVLPYDLYTADGASELAQRMALNMTNILKEESYFDKVCDVLGGSYSLENVQDELTDSAWKSFQKIEAHGGLFSEETKNTFYKEIKAIRDKRIAQYSSGDKTLIGVNKFENPDDINDTWTNIPNYEGLTSLVLENELQNSIA
ncbi:MAG: methylmalonyl-CoA mutase family protein [Crocinitomicaceae bacterium]